MPIDLRALVTTAAALNLLALASCGFEMKDPAKEARDAARARTQARELARACSSQATYDRLKQVAFEEAIRIRNADPENLDILATHSVVRMEEPRVKSRDETLDVTVCSGRFVLELPPGAEQAFGGERRLKADIEYGAQRAADGSGLVYQIKGAEPIIYKLAAFDLKRQGKRLPAAVAETQVAARTTEPVPTPALDENEPRAAPKRPEPPMEAPRPAPTPTREPARAEAAAAPSPSAPATRRSSPSFNCRHARTRSEHMVCGSPRLAALDRAMSSVYYASLSNADRDTRAELRRSRDRFLAYRDRCPSESCVAEAYRDRINEIHDIAEGT